MQVTFLYVIHRQTQVTFINFKIKIKFGSLTKLNIKHQYGGKGSSSFDRVLAQSKALIPSSGSTGQWSQIVEG